MNYKGVVIDAGHGGSDGGAVGNNIVEKDCVDIDVNDFIALLI